MGPARFHCATLLLRERACAVMPEGLQRGNGEKERREGEKTKKEVVWLTSRAAAEEVSPLSDAIPRPLTAGTFGCLGFTPSDPVRPSLGNLDPHRTPPWGPC